MAGKKHFLGMLLLALAFGAIAVGCVSTTPILNTVNSGSEFVILGEVRHTVREGGRSGLIDFLEVAKRQYPETDFVIDILVDRRVTTIPLIGPISFLLTGQTTTFEIVNIDFRGTAIKYINLKE
ncbi:MAG: hypothetical protein LBH44_03150 [Treponema sp.]|nr:hypothetical protein [Treponema sp.]